MTTAYYNEIDPFAAQWLRNLINAGHIAPGIVDERSIEDDMACQKLQRTVAALVGHGASLLLPL